MMDEKQLTPRELFRKGYEQTEKKPEEKTKTVFEEILKTKNLDELSPHLLFRLGYYNSNKG